MSPARRKTIEEEAGFIDFGEAARMADPAVSALLNQSERRQSEARLPQKDREKKKKEREKIRARRPFHTTYDIPIELRQRIKDLAEKERVPASQIAALALLRFVRDYDSRAIDLLGYKVASSSPRYDFNLVLPVEEYGLLGRRPAARSRGRKDQG